MAPSLVQLMQQAVQFHRAGQFPQAEQLYRQVIAIDPRNADAHHFLGVMALQLGKPDLSIQIIRHALSINPNFPQACYNLGLAYLDKADRDNAIACFQQALSMRADYPEAMFNLGLMYQERNRLDEALPILEKLLTRIDKFPPRSGPIVANSNDFIDGDQSVTLTCREDFARVYNLLGITCKARGQADQAIAMFRKALELRPDYASAHSNLLYTLLFHPQADPAQIAREHSLWNERYAVPLAEHIAPHANDRSPDRPLRIGYVSPDLTAHPVGRFILPLLENHDREKFKIYCYSNVVKPDAFTEQIAALASASGAYRRTVRMPHSHVAKIIRDDQIDILVDLTMHTDKNRLLVFARKPAPIQVTYLAYVGTTGLPAVDYRFSDPYLDPPGADESVYAEKTVRLSSTYWCYEPLPNMPEVSPLPAVANGYMTFGSLNSFSKVTDRVLAVWAELLAKIPNSRLLMICPLGSHRERVLAAFAAQNVAAEHIDFLAAVPLDQYFQLYHRVDIALDPFPYGGGTTTCDALYMGVPVITLRGQNAMTRAAASILSTAGLPEFIVESAEQYVEIAAALTRDIDRLVQLRCSLRDRVKSSPLMDALRYAADVETRYREMWRNWCNAAPGTNLR